nr:LuxR C-terminal-related transcriptional regulator [Caballeronia sp. GAWG1-5s-s]
MVRATILRTWADSRCAAVVTLAVSNDVNESTVALREGDCGYLLRRIKAEAAASDPFTSRKQDIIRELSRRASNEGNAPTRSPAESTVKIHVRNILRKLNFTSRVHVALYAAGHDADRSDAATAPISYETS